MQLLHKIFEHSGVEEAVSHWSDKSFYVCSMDNFECVESNSYKGLALFGYLGHTDPIVWSTISMQSMLILGGFERIPPGNFDK